MKEKDRECPNQMLNNSNKQVELLSRLFSISMETTA